VTTFKSNTRGAIFLFYYYFLFFPFGPPFGGPKSGWGGERTQKVTNRHDTASSAETFIEAPGKIVGTSVKAKS